MSHCVDPIFKAVAEPYCAKLREPDVPAGLSVNVSDVMAIVTTWLVMFTNVMAVPTGNATLLFAGIVNVLALASVDG